VVTGVLVLIGGGVAYAGEKRRRGAVDTRRFFLSYGLFCAFVACSLCSLVLHGLHWLLYVAIGIAVLSYALNFADWRRNRARLMSGDEDREPRRRR